MGTPPAVPDRYAVVGFPVDHSHSPRIHELFAHQTGEFIAYTRLAARPAEFEAAVAAFVARGGKGLNVTVPHKEAAFELADEVGPEAESARAVNTLSFLAGNRIRGDNTDGVGFRRDLGNNHGLSLDGKRVLILGAGGAARGILAALLDAGTRELIVANRTVQRARDLLAELATPEQFSACPIPELRDHDPFDLVVNATSVGLHGDSPPFPPGCLAARSLAYDLVYSPDETPFVSWARRHGAGRAVQGWGMLVEQAAESFAIWRGIRPDTAPVLRQILPRRGR